MSDWFAEWLVLHCDAVAAPSGTAELLRAERGVFLGWQATTAELGACTARLVGRPASSPRVAVDAIGRELVRLREERSERAAPPGDFAPDCPACGGSGMAVIPLKECRLKDDRGEWQVCYSPGTTRVATGAVLCDRSGCEAGRISREKESQRKDDKPRRATLSACEAASGCSDLPGLLRRYEREEAARVRGGQPSCLAMAPALRAILERAKGRRDAA